MNKLLLLLIIPLLFSCNKTKEKVIPIQHLVEKGNEKTPLFYYNEKLFTGFGEEYYNAHLELWRTKKFIDFWGSDWRTYDENKNIFTYSKNTDLTFLNIAANMDAIMQAIVVAGDISPSLIAGGVREVLKEHFGHHSPIVTNINNNSKDILKAEEYFNFLSTMQDSVVFYFTNKPDWANPFNNSQKIDEDYIQVLALEGPNPIMSGDFVKKAIPTIDKTDNQSTIKIEIKEGVKRQFAQITKQMSPNYENQYQGQYIVIALNQKVLSYPRVMQQLEDFFIISGNFSKRESQNLAKIINGEQLKMRIEFKDGKKINEECWDENGNEIECN